MGKKKIENRKIMCFPAVKLCLYSYKGFVLLGLFHVTVETAYMDQWFSLGLFIHETHGKKTIKLILDYIFDTFPRGNSTPVTCLCQVHDALFL